ncbi:MAG: ABC transporter permease [Ignavibacteriaceae bacterium]|nr:ABC transporter permease [Ignavibacteriaceae bacterium]
MLNKRTITIIKRELKVRLFSRTFIIMTLLIPLFMFGILGLQTYLLNYSGSENALLIIASESQRVLDNVQAELKLIPKNHEGELKFMFEKLEKSKLEERLSNIRLQILEEKITGLVFIPDQALKNKKIEYFSKNPNNNLLLNKLKPSINKVLTDMYFVGRRLSTEELEFAKNNVDFNGYRISADKKIEEEGIGNTVLSFLFTFLLYMSLLFIGQMTMTSVIEEKSNKIVEVLLSSVSSKELMAGKIIGTSITGLAQMAIWISPLIILLSTTWFVLPPEFTLKLSVWHLVFFLYNYFIALITFLGLFATVGSIFDNPQDAQSGIWPIMMLIIIPFFISIGMQTNPENQIARIASFVPFASLIVMPARITLVDIPLIQLIISMLINIAAMILIFILAGKIYRVGILITGKKPKWSEVVKWFKYNY